MAKPNQILWPSRYEPANCPVHVRNELAMASAPETVWAWLIRAQLWPTWYPNSANIMFLADPPPDLTLGAGFAGKHLASQSNQQCLNFCPTSDSRGMHAALALMLTMHGLSKKQTKAATSSSRRRSEAGLPDWEKP
jgi:hypothetical protein